MATHPRYTRRELLGLAGCTGMVLFTGIAPGWGADADGTTAATVGDDGMVTCPQCKGVGSTRCPAHCKQGKVRCPATCLKKDDQGWEPGPEGKTVKKFPNHAPAAAGYVWFSTLHIGQLIVYENGLAVSKGTCPTCHGTSVVDCKVCKGTGSVTCPLCHGAKRVTPADHDAFEKQQEAARNADAIFLADGRTIHGKIMMRGADQILIKSADGEIVSVKPEDVVDHPVTPDAGAGGSADATAAGATP